MFLGTHTPKLDEKGRVILPAKFRDELTDGDGQPLAIALVQFANHDTVQLRPEALPAPATESPRLGD